MQASVTTATSLFVNNVKLSEKSSLTLIASHAISSLVSKQSRYKNLVASIHLLLLL